MCYHVINRGNGQATVFHKPADYDAVVKLLAQACARLPMRLLAYCLMPSHIHLVLWPLGDGDLGRWMQWLLTAHVRRYHRHYRTSGHVWQGRFKAFPIQGDAHLLTVLRYVERNPLRANLVARAEDWAWSSLPGFCAQPRPTMLHSGPLERSPDWLDCVNRPETAEELAALRRSVNRGTPWGGDDWVERTAHRLGLEASLKPRGRPTQKK